MLKDEEDVKIVSINLGLLGSTGKIMYRISELVEQNGGQALMIYPTLPQNFTERDQDLKLKGTINRKINSLLEKLTGYYGCFSFRNTRRIIKYLEKTSPDIIHLHNIHMMKLNHRMLFSYIKKKNISVVWTLHDCWSFTGKCAHFTMIQCEKWRDGCEHCPQYRSYPATYVDKTKALWKWKREWFTGVNDMTLITPSQWLADLVKQSFLREYPIQVIHNGIDLTIFKPTDSDFRVKYGVGFKYIVLGVAFGWDKRKGLDVFIDLAKRLDNDKYQIVLVGTNDNVDKQLPSNIISIHKTNNQQELAAIYSTSNVFMNPTREEVLGMVNAEALACGLPIVTFNTGGCPEIVDKTCGSIVACDDNEMMFSEVVRICEQRPYSKEACLKRAKSFDANRKFAEYLDIYKRMMEKKNGGE